MSRCITGGQLHITGTGVLLTVGAVEGCCSSITRHCSCCCCRFVGCPQLKGEPLGLIKRLRQAYLGGPGGPSLELVLQELRQPGGGRRPRRGEAGSDHQARSSEGPKAEPGQGEQCLHCKKPGHRCAHTPAACVSRAQALAAAFREHRCAGGRCGGAPASV